MALTKADIINEIHKGLGFSKKESMEVVEALLEIMKETMENGEDVMISGYGKFCVREKKERKGRNPATGDDLILRKRRVVTFKCSGRLREKMNENRKNKTKKKKQKSSSAKAYCIFCGSTVGQISDRTENRVNAVYDCPTCEKNYCDQCSYKKEDDGQTEYFCLRCDSHMDKVM